MIDSTKDVTIGNHRFRLGRVQARVGSFLLMKLMGSLQTAAREAFADPDMRARLEASMAPDKVEASVTPPEPPDPEIAAAMAVQDMLQRLSFDEFSQVQRFALSAVSRYEPDGTVPFPVLMEDGSFALQDLEGDIMAVYGVTSQQLVFVLTPFFAAGR